ncbi:hypothetical protein GF361_05435 [Candidatus Woesearchaeota archaeon]|nr:hypothetical protein [Candidatus Woesearchaeota archaeon]
MIESIIWIILIIVIGIVMFKITKSILKTMFLVFSAVSLIILIFGFFVISDTMDFNENFQTQPSLFLLGDSGELTAGFSGIPSEEAQFTFLSEERLGSYNESNLENILQDNYKIFLIKKDAFGSVDQIEAENINITKKEIFNIIDSETPVYDYLRLQPEEIPESVLPQAKEDILSQMDIETEAEFKGLIFAILFSKTMENPLFLFSQHQKENIIVYPETAMFKFIKRMPLSLIDNLVNVKRGEQDRDT